jgi:mannose-1-phosphate guanylyltransferase
MKAFLLAAGHGTRLRPLTDNLPKCLLPIQGVSMLEIWLEVCRRNGIDELLINLHAHADAVREELNRHHHENGLKVQLSEEKSLLGSAGTLRLNRDWVKSESEFWVLYADVLTNLDLRKMMEFHRRDRPAATLGLYQVSDPKRCGVVMFDEKNVILEFVEKPENPKSHWAFSGVLVGTRELLDEIPPDLPVDLGFSVLPKLAGRMLAYPINDYLLDIGTPENYQMAQKSWPGWSARSNGKDACDRN